MNSKLGKAARIRTEDILEHTHRRFTADRNESDYEKLCRTDSFTIDADWIFAPIDQHTSTQIYKVCKLYHV